MCLNFGIHCNCSSTASQVGTQSCVHLALKTLLLCDLSLPVSTEEFGILAILKEVFCGFTQYLKVYIKIVTRIKLGPFPFTKLLAQNRDSIIYIATSYGMGCSGFKFKEEREFLTSRTIHSGSGDHLVSYSMHIWFILGGLQQSKHDDHLLPSGSEVKNERSYTSPFYMCLSNMHRDTTGKTFNISSITYML